MQAQMWLSARTLDELGKDMQRLATISSALNADMGIRIDPSGERISVVDDRGRILDGMKILAVMTSLFLRSHRNGTVAAPVTAPSALQHIAKHYDGFYSAYQGAPLCFNGCGWT